MIVRTAQKEDREQIEKLAEKYGLSLPGEGTVIVVENSEGEITAFTNIRAVLMIEPFVSDTPFASEKLWDHIQAKAQLGGYKILRCFAQERNKGLFEKLGFYRIFEKYIPMEINFYNK